MSQCPPSSGILPQQNEIIEDLEILSKIVSGLISLRSPYSSRLHNIAKEIELLTSEIKKLEPSQLDPIAKLLENRKVRARVWTDGSCYNQGFAEPRAAFAVFWGEGHPNNHSEKITGVNDSTRAELFAAHYAIKQALDQDYFAIKLYSDCRFVEEVIKRPSDFMRDKHKDFRDLVSEISAMMKNIHVSLEHVDSSDPGNRVADALAKKPTNPRETETQRRNRQRRQAKTRALINKYRLMFSKFSESLHVFLCSSGVMLKICYATIVYNIFFRVFRFTDRVIHVKEKNEEKND